MIAENQGSGSGPSEKTTRGTACVRWSITAPERSPWTRSLTPLVPLLATGFLGNLIGGVGLVTSIRLLRVPHRVAEERRASSEPGPGNGKEWPG
jgi:hypothetical protein